MVQKTVTACTRKRCTCLFIYSCQSSLFKCWAGRHPVFCMPAKFHVIFHPTQANLMWDTTPALFPLISTCSHPVLPSPIVRDHIVDLTASSTNQQSDINQLDSARGLWWSNDSSMTSIYSPCRYHISNRRLLSRLKLFSRLCIWSGDLSLANRSVLHCSAFTTPLPTPPRTYRRCKRGCSHGNCDSERDDLGN